MTRDYAVRTGASVETGEAVIYGLWCCCHPERGIRYVGQTSRGARRRLYEHLWDSGPTRSRLKDADLPVHNWIRKHGASNIRQEVLERLEHEGALDAAEIHWIEKLGTQVRPNGLNLHAGGDSRRGWTHDVETRKAISEANRRRPGGNCTLKHAHVPEIRRRIIAGERYVTIAADFGVGYSVVSEIASGKTFARINDDGVFDPKLPRPRPSIQNGHASHRLAEKRPIILRLLAEGRGRLSIGQEVGCSRSTVDRVAKERELAVAA